MISNNLTCPKTFLKPPRLSIVKPVKERLMRGRRIQALTSAALYLACRQCGASAHLRRDCASQQRQQKIVGRSTYASYQRTINSIPPLKPSQYITKFSTNSLCKVKWKKLPTKILGSAKELKLTSGRGPTGIAAAASYIASVS
jgi:transcription initiation factor TFIIB